MRNATRRYPLWLGKIFLLGIVLIFSFITKAGATDYRSTNFIIRDPIITVHSGRSTSSNFQLYSSSGGFVLGQNSSASFIARSGFLYYPVVSSPVLTVTPGDKEVTLSWTSSASVTGLGFTVSGLEYSGCAWST